MWYSVSDIVVPLLVFQPRASPTGQLVYSFRVWTGPNDSILINGIYRRDISLSKNSLCEMVTLLLSADQCLLSLHTQAALLEKPVWQGTEVGLQPTTGKELRLSVQSPSKKWIPPATTWVNLELNLSLVEAPDGPPESRPTLWLVLWENLRQRTQQLCNDTCELS